MPSLTRNGVRLHYSDTGSGSAVFFHTGGGGDGTMWRSAGYLDALPHMRHILFDHRGHGLSDQPRELRAHLIDEYVADVIAVLDAVGVERAGMIGYSDGAYVLFTIAAHHPERVSAMVKIGGVAHPRDTNAARRDAAEEARRIGIRGFLDRMALREAQPPPRWLMENLGATASDMFALELAGWAQAPSECAMFPKILAPTLIVCGELEDTDGAAAIAAKTLPNGTAVVVPGFGHLQAFWRSDVTAPIVREFLTRQVSLPTT